MKAMAFYSKKTFLTVLAASIAILIATSLILLLLLRQFSPKPSISRISPSNRALGEPTSPTEQKLTTYEFIGTFVDPPKVRSDQVVIGTFVLDGDPRLTPITIVLGNPEQDFTMGEYEPENGTFSKNVTFKRIRASDLESLIQARQPVLIRVAVPAYDRLDAKLGYLRNIEDTAKSLQDFVEGRTSQVPEAAVLQVTTIGVLK